MAIGPMSSSIGQTPCVPPPNCEAEHSLKMVVRAMDLFHIAIAIEVGLK